MSVYNSSHTGTQIDAFDTILTAGLNTKLDKSGGTITGNLTTANKSVIIDTTLSNDVTPSSNAYSNGIVTFHSNDNTPVSIGYLQACTWSNGSQGLQIVARKKIDGTNNDSKLRLYINNEGTPAGDFNGSLILTKTTDVSATEFNYPALVVGGGTTSAHMEFDANEIVAKASGGTSLADLWLQDTVKITSAKNEIIIGTGYYGSYINCTRHAAFCVGAAPNTGSGALSALSVRTPSGAWSINTYTGEQLQFTYGTNTNYNAGTNSCTTAKITAAGAFTNASQRKLKENITLVDYSCLDIINSVKICSFNMKGDPEKDYRVGFIADDTDSILSGKNHDVMDLQNCIGVMIKAIQELSTEIEKLKAQLKTNN